MFTTSGAQLAIDAGMPDVVSVILGVLTAVFGGVLRAVVCNEIPRAFADLPQWGALPAWQAGAPLRDEDHDAMRR